MHKSNVGIFIFDGIDILDLAGPFEVFSRTRLTPGADSRRSDETAPFHVFTIARTIAGVSAGGGLHILPQYSFSQAPEIDVLIIPGGLGTRKLLQDEAVIEWIRDTAGMVKIVASVCTGSLLLARAGLLRNRRATTHWAAIKELTAIEPTAIIERAERVVNDGVITSGGVSSGIDMALAIVESLHGTVVANETARWIEFLRTRYSVNRD